MKEDLAPKKAQGKPHQALIDDPEDNDNFNDQLPSQNGDKVSMEKLNVDDWRETEKFRVQSIKADQVEQDLQGGELAFRVRSGRNLPKIKNKEKFAFQIDLPRYDRNGSLMKPALNVQMKNQDPSTGKFRLKVRLLIPNHNINMYQDVIHVKVFKLREEDTDFKMADKTYIGSILVKWKQVFATTKDGASAIVKFEEELIDPEKECTIDISGLLEGEFQWISFGHGTSNYAETGEKKDEKRMANNLEGIVNLNFGKDGSLSMTAREIKAGQGGGIDMTKNYQVKF
mmetsp:Transcript_5802/g.9260  ORF Transcript_5802/g.9260 Transcript_5802/m.9260 type:complete len:285 (+) Transcript_5802:3052-3906(+)